jgi:CelD/BcsL family acetyltransferase involved in cellulose biosynthesis
MSRISVSTSPSELDSEQWNDLARRVQPNVFLHPAALQTARETGFAKLLTLLAFDESVTPRRLVGVWALQIKMLLPLIAVILVAPAYEYAFLSCPLIDPALRSEVIEAFFAAIAKEGRLPKVLRLSYLDGGSETYAAILKALARGRKGLTLAARDRPVAFRDSSMKRSGSTRKKLRQDWNRLSAFGTVEIVNDRDPERVAQTFEGFLAMEAASWKGANGTALLSKAKDAAFARRLIGDLAAASSASVAVMSLNGRPIACQVLLYSGTTAYTWKTAFDSEFANFSPGSVLVDRITEQLFASGEIESIEACSPEGGFMTRLFTGRRPTVDLLVKLDDKPSLTFALAALAYNLRRHAKRWRDAARSWVQQTSLKPPAAHATH